MGLPNIITKINSLETKHTALETKHNNFETKYNSEVVKLSGNQTVGGVKTFTSVPFVKGTAPALSLQNTNMVKGTTPTANQTCLINCFENAGTASKNRLGLFQTAYRTSGAVDVGMYVYKPEAGSTSLASINVIYPASGNPYGTAPTPDATANGTHIATTAWVRGKGVLIESSKSASTFYRKYSDGWIEQGGNLTVTTSATITFPKAFGTKCVVCITSPYNQPTNSTGDTNYITKPKSITNTSFVLHYRDSDSTATRTGICSWYACGY